MVNRPFFILANPAQFGPAVDVLETVKSIVSRDAKLDGESPVRYVHVEDQTELEFATPPAGLVFIDALPTFFLNVKRIPKDTWVCVISFCYDDVCSAFLSPDRLAQLTRIDAVFSNVGVFLERMKSTKTSVEHTHRPVCENDLPYIHGFGSVIYNVADRDFSLLSYVYSIWSEGKINGPAFRIFGPADMKLPAPLNHADQFQLEGDQAFKETSVFIPAPRVSDIRAKLISPEIRLALKHDCRVCVPVHPVYSQCIGITTMPSMQALRGWYKGMLNNYAYSETKTIGVEPLPTAIAFGKSIVAKFNHWLAR